MDSEKKDGGKRGGSKSFYEILRKKRMARTSELLAKYAGTPIEEVLPLEAKAAVMRTIARGESSVREEVELKADLALINKVLPDRHHTQVTGEIVTVAHSVPPMKGETK